VGIIAGTGNDADNLSIIMTARELNSKLMTVVRQNLASNELIFERSKSDFVMQPARIIATRILAHLKTPMLAEFIELAMRLDEVDARELIQRIANSVGDEVVESRAVTLGVDMTPAVIDYLEAGGTLNLRSLTKSPEDRGKMLSLLPLLVKRGEELFFEPGELLELKVGDQILFCGTLDAIRDQRWAFENSRSLQYLVDGTEPSRGFLLNLLKG
jgi:Trk K+ transport system NAD-binding subunit